jgi:hypothetical protein
MGFSRASADGSASSEKPCDPSPYVAADEA